MIQPYRYYFYVLMSLAPHFFIFSKDILIIIILFLFWTAAVFLKKWPSPKRALLHVVTLATAFGCYLRFGSLANPDAATALLCLITILKLFETHSYKDAMALLIMNLIVVMTYLIHSFSLFASTYMIFIFIYTVYLMMELQKKLFFLKQTQTRWHQMLSLETVIAMPLLVALFVFFPRFTTNFGSGERIVQTTGFSDSIELGQMINLTQSTEIAFKVRFLESAKIDYTKLYFRGSVLNKNDNLKWSKATTSAQILEISDNASGAQYQILMPPRQQKNLFTLSNTTITKITPKIFVLEKKIEDIFIMSSANEKNISYWAKEKEQLPLASYGEEDLNINIVKSDTLNSILKSVDATTVELKVDNILNYFKNKGFVYSTEVPAYKNINDFFTNKVGFCEHYASAFVTLSRLLNVPSRIVVGYMGGEINPYDNSLVVRDQYAHAWAEVFIHNKGWVRVDPTAAVYPVRLEQTFTKTNLGGLFYQNFLANSLFFLESINTKFELFIINYGGESQWKFFSWISQKWNLKYVVAVLVFFLVLIFILVMVWWLWNLEYKKEDWLKKSYKLLLKKLAHYGIQKEDCEGPLELKFRVLNNSQIPHTYAQHLQEYIQLRFSQPENSLANLNFFKKIKKWRE